MTILFQQIVRLHKTTNQLKPLICIYTLLENKHHQMFSMLSPDFDDPDKMGKSSMQKSFNLPLVTNKVTPQPMQSHKILGVTFNLKQDL